MADIKTREVVKGTIKTLDKAAIVSGRMKAAYTKTKERAESTQSVDEGSPAEYAANRVSRNVEMVAREGGHQFNEVGKKAAAETKANLIKSRQSIKNIAGIKTKGNITNGTKGLSLIKGSEKVAIKNTSSLSGKAMLVKRQKAIAEKRMARKAAEQSYHTTRRIAKASRRAVFILGRAAKKIAIGTKALISAIIAGGWVAVTIIVICCLFGAALFFFGGNEANYITVSPEVEAYSDTIQKYAKEYDILEYTELIKAVMMQESKGKGDDPMGSGAKNSEESIKLGVKKIANLIKQTGCESPLDMTNIRVVLKKYNSGEDDDKYANNVLQYYPYGNFSDEILVLGNGVLGLPIKGMTQANISSHFGPRVSPGGGIGSTDHKGVDIAFPTGTKIYACESGTVTVAGWNGGFGKCVIIDHGNGMQTIYAHMSKVNTAKGMKVVRGQLIGEVGNTGNSTGPHLHLAVMVNGKYVNPEKGYLSIPD